MTKIRLALLDSDGYMTSLVGYLCKKWRAILETRLFTDVKVLEKYVNQGQVDVLLAAEDASNEVEVFKDQIPQLLFLVENHKENGSFVYPGIFKYQSAEEIVKELLAFVAENEKIPYNAGIISKRTVEIIGGYAPFGGGGVTEFLLCQSKKAAVDEKILYVNLEEFHGLSFGKKEKQMQTEQIHRGMSEVLFYLRGKKGKLGLKMESIVYRKGNLDFIFSVEDYRDLHSLRREDMVEFLKVLLEQTEYQKIFFDIGFICDATLYLMEECNILYMPKPVTDIQVSKEKAFQKNLMREKREAILKKRTFFSKAQRCVAEL